MVSVALRTGVKVHVFSGLTLCELALLQSLWRAGRCRNPGRTPVIYEFFYRKARPLTALGVVAFAVTAAAVVGWMTAPV